MASAKEFFHYYQTSEHSRWEAVPESSKPELEKMGAKRVSILAVSPLVTDENKSNVFYKGPFYIDIDNADVTESIRSAQDLLRRIQAWGFPESSFQIFCSGMKGFHFIFHEKLFYSGRPLKNLPDIYEQLAIEFHVPGLDQGVYHRGKGTLFRLPNVQRDDGRYRVFLTQEELLSITPEWYIYYTSTPRKVATMPLQAPDVPCSRALEMFQAAEERSSRKRDEFDRFEPTPAEALEQFREDPPRCVEALCNGEIRTGVKFNHAAMQLGIYMVRSQTLMNTLTPRVSLFASKTNSTTYSTQEARIQHVNGLIGYFRAHTDKNFSCAAMRSILASRPCKDCPIENAVQVQNDCYEIEERKDGYYLIYGKNEKRLTSFTLLPYRSVFVEDMSGGGTRRAYTLCQVELLGERVPGSFKIEEEAWGSRAAFIKCFSGVGNLRVTATDNDIQMLKHWVMRDTEKLDDQIEVGAVGIHCNKINGKLRYTYVEKGFSMNKWGVPDTHQFPADLSYESSALPQIDKVGYPGRGHFNYETLAKHLFNINEPKVVAPLLGWLSACHLKSHIMSVWHEFPLFALWGGRGSGKTRTASATAGGLHACDFQTYSPPSIGQATPFAVLDTITKTTTVPRVLDEFNRHGMRPGVYEHYTEMFKAAYNNAAVSKGRLLRAGERGRHGIGATSDHYFVTAPLLLLSEHAPEVPALLDRMYLVMLKEPSIAGRQEHMREITMNQPRLWELAKSMVRQALLIKPEWVVESYDRWAKQISQEYGERQAHSRRVIGVGLDFLEKVFVGEVGLHVLPEIDELRSSFTEQCNVYESVAEHAGFQTEVDKILMRLGGMVSLHKRRGTDAKLPKGMYKIDVASRILYIDPITAFLALEEMYAERREMMPIRQPQQFIKILSSEKYFIGAEVVPEMTTSYRVLALNTEEMTKKGLDVTLFY